MSPMQRFFMGLRIGCGNGSWGLSCANPEEIFRTAQDDRSKAACHPSIGIRQSTFDTKKGPASPETGPLNGSKLV